MRKTRRRILIVLCTVAIVFISAVLALAVWLWWPDTNKLTAAAARGDVSTVRTCLRFGVDPNSFSRTGWRNEGYGVTPLIAAARAGHVEVVEFLLKSGADPNLHGGGTEYPDETPLWVAAVQGRLKVCRVLFDAGADPNLPAHPGSPNLAASPQMQNRARWTPLDEALQVKQFQVADLLRQHGAVESKR